MPVDPRDYHPRWDRIATAVKQRAGWKCELCGEVHGLDDVVLTVHHRDGNPGNNRRSNLIALCARCHLAAHRRARVYGYGVGQLDLF